MRRVLMIGMLLLLPALASAATVGSSCTLSWTPPTTNADGTPLTDLASYGVYWATTSNGQVSGTPQATVAAPSSSATCAAVGFPAGRWFVKLTAIDTVGNESAFSNEVDVTMDPTPPAAPSNLIVQ